MKSSSLARAFELAKLAARVGLKGAATAHPFREIEEEAHLDFSGQVDTK